MGVWFFLLCFIEQKTDCKLTKGDKGQREHFLLVWIRNSGLFLWCVEMTKPLCCTLLSLTDPRNRATHAYWLVILDYLRLGFWYFFQPVSVPVLNSQIFKLLHYKQFFLKLILYPNTQQHEQVNSSVKLLNRYKRFCQCDVVIRVFYVEPAARLRP